MEQHMATSRLYSQYGQYGKDGDKKLKIATGKFNGKTITLVGTFICKSWGVPPGQINADKFVRQQLNDLGYGNHKFLINPRCSLQLDKTQRRIKRNLSTTKWK